MKKNDRIWRERIQVVVEYFDSRLHQIVRFTLIKGCERMLRERPMALVEYFDSRLHQSCSVDWWRKTIECGEKGCRSSMNILTPAFTRLYSWQKMVECGGFRPSLNIFLLPPSRRMWRERIQAVVEYIDSRFHQSCSTDEGKWFNVEGKTSCYHLTPCFSKLYSLWIKEYCTVCKNVERKDLLWYHLLDCLLWPESPFETPPDSGAPCYSQELTPPSPSSRRWTVR